MNILKKQGVAWCLTAVMIVAAVIIGGAKAPASNAGVVQTPIVYPDTPTSADSYVWDEADILSDATEEELELRNQTLLRDLNVVIAVATCYNGGDIYETALELRDTRGLADWDFIILIDMASERYILVQGDALVNRFSGATCDEYAAVFMHEHLVNGDFDRAVLELFAALESWYYTEF